MDMELLSKVRCPICRSSLYKEVNKLVCKNGHSFGIIDEIPDLVPPGILPKTAEPFDRFPERYDSWYDRHSGLYVNELRAISAPEVGWHDSLDIGVGTGRFAHALGIPYGVDPSLAMLKLARKRGIKVVRGIAEDLPFKDGSFQNALMTFTICFVEDPKKAIEEALRVIRSYLVIAFIPRDSPWGRFYMSKKETSPFYSVARFYTYDEIASWVDGLGKIEEIYSTLFSEPESEEPEIPIAGLHEGASLVVLKIKKL